MKYPPSIKLLNHFVTCYTRFSVTVENSPKLRERSSVPRQERRVEINCEIRLQLQNAELNLLGIDSRDDQIWGKVGCSRIDLITLRDVLNSYS